MATPNILIINALRDTAKRLKDGAYYAWGHHGACNCGHLLQSVTQLSKEEILRYAHTGIGEWTELADDYCTTTNAPVDLLLKKLAEIGFTPSDIHSIEYLTDRQVLDKLPGGFRWLSRNVREDVTVYMETFATLLEDRLLETIHLQGLIKEVNDFVEEEELVLA